MRLYKEEALTFDDVLLVPRFSNIKSRKHVNTTSRFTRNFFISKPIISANMDTVTESNMMLAMHNLGGVGILHRFLSLEDTEKQIAKFLSNFKDDESPITAVSIGFNDDYKKRLELYKRYNVSVVCIDVAHGWCKQMLNMIQYIKDKYKFDVIAGNIADPEAIDDLCCAGADAIKVGIGPGSMCTTRLVTGCGVPQLSAISECSEEASGYNIPIIADGGIAKSGDIVKALAAGASTVMIGNLISGTDETPGNAIQDISCKKFYKQYRGMASDDAMTGWKGKDYHAAPEGESKIVECKGPVSPIIERLVAGVRSGMTYCNARTIVELQHNALFRRVSSNSISENRPHGIN